MRQPKQSQAVLERNKAPPTDYYAKNLNVLVRTVIDQYADILSESERAFGSSILGLSPDARRLFARIVSRKTPILFEDQLQYREIQNVRTALEQLETYGLICVNACIPADILLARLTVAELGSEYPYVKRCTPKSRYVDVIACRYTDRHIRKSVAQRRRWLTIRDRKTLDLFFLLFFGDRSTDLSAFVTRDLGIIQYESYSLKRKDRQFNSLTELTTYLDWASLSDSLGQADTAPTPGRVSMYIEMLRQSSANRTLERYRSRILNRLGHLLERAKQSRFAIRAYRYSFRHPARERIVRILYRSGKRNSALRMRDKILADPWCKDEEYFARRFQVPRTKSDLFSIDSETLNGNPIKSIEQYALQCLATTGAMGWHLENSLPLALFGLAYWEWMYTSIPGAFTNQFQSGPRDLYWPEFLEVRKNQCSDPLEDNSSLCEQILKTAKSKRGLANRLINWDVVPEHVLQDIVYSIGDDDLQSLLKIVRSDLSQMRSGFPDLTVLYPSGRYEFVEVKGPGDQVQRNQRFWLNSLAREGLPARVLRFEN